MNRQQSFLFVHGWGFDAGVWDPLCRALPEARITVTERGYLGSQPRGLQDVSVPEGTVAVGHSAGVIELLCNLPVACCGLVAINGFTRFTAGPDFPDGVPERVLDRMAARLARDPSDTLTAFRSRCGGGPEVSDAWRHVPPEAGLLADGLAQLRDCDARARLAALSLPVLTLAATRDPVVPAALTSACFDHATIAWSDAAGHVLPLSQPEWCADRLRAFAPA